MALIGRLVATLVAKWVILMAIAGCSQPAAPTAQIQLANHGLLSAALSPDGKRLFTGSFQHGGALWDSHAKGRLFDWNHNSDGYSAYHAADFSEDGQFLAATDGTAVAIWDTKSGESRLFLESPAQSLAIQNSQAIWQTSDGQAEAYWRRPARILDLALSKQYLLIGLENQVALLIDITQQTVIGALPHDDVITDLGMDDFARVAVTGTRDGTVTLWSLEDGSVIQQQTFSSPVSFTAISPDGTQFIAAAARGPVILDKSGSTREIFTGNPGVIAADFSDDNKISLGTSREQVWIINADSGEVAGRWRVPNKGPWHKAAIMALSRESEMIQAIASDGYAYQLN